MKHGRSQSQAGTDDEPHQEVELGVAIELGMAVDAVAPRRFGQLVRRSRSAHRRRRGAAAQPRSSGAPPAEPAIGRQQAGDQRLDLVHQRRIVEPQPVPLDAG